MFHALDLFFMVPFALGLTGLFGGHASTTDRKNQLSSWGQLNDIFNFGSTTGKSQVTSGAEGLDKAKNYFDAIMSGDQAKMSQVLAPQISVINNQNQQRVNSLAQFGNRSGGTNAAMQSDQEAATKSIQQLFDMLGPEAAKEVASISGAQEGMGSNLLGLASNAASTKGYQAGGARAQDVQNEMQTGAAAGQAIASLLALV